MIEWNRIRFVTTLVHETYYVAVKCHLHFLCVVSEEFASPLWSHVLKGSSLEEVDMQNKQKGEPLH